MRHSKLLIFVILLTILLSGCVEKMTTNKRVELYPASEIQDNKKLWGFIGPKGEFVVEPKYEELTDFSTTGLAKFKLNNGYGVLNSKGEEIVPASFQFISDLNNEYFYAFDGKSNHVFNAKGERKFFTDEFLYIGTYSDGLFPAAMLNNEAEPKFGYLDRTGKVVVEPVYEEAWAFRNGMGLVKVADNKYEIISTDGKTKKELSYSLVTQIDDTDLYFFATEERGKLGLLDKDGNVVAEPKFTKVYDVADGHIVFAENQNDEEFFGVSDMNGNTVLEPEYDSIKALGKGYFAVGDKGTKKIALVNSEGEFVTDYIYNELGSDEKLESDLIPAFDGENTYLIDFTGRESNALPEILGKANVVYYGDISKVNSNGKISYYSSKGDLIWEENNFYILKGNAKVTEHSFINEEGMNIKYPVVEGLKEKGVEDGINSELYRLFVEEIIEEFNSNNYSFFTTSFRVNRVNDLLIIDSVEEYITDDEIYPIRSGKIYNISLSKGTFFNFEDLFKEGSPYLETITDMVRGQMEQQTMQGAGFYDVSQWKGIKSDVNFIAQTKTIDIYLNPEEVNSVTGIFPKFTIEQDKISELFDLNSEFWWTFSVSRGF